jgi:hypothetical protein
VSIPSFFSQSPASCRRAFGSACSITEESWTPTGAREFALSWPRPSCGGVGSHKLRYERLRRVGRINQPESMDPRARSHEPFLADSPRFVGWRSLDRRCPTSNALCRYARTAHTTPNRASSSEATRAVLATGTVSLTGLPRTGFAHSG